MEIEAKLKEGDKGKFNLEMKASSDQLEATVLVKDISLENLTDTLNRFLKNFRRPPS